MIRGGRHHQEGPQNVLQGLVVGAAETVLSCLAGMHVAAAATAAVVVAYQQQQVASRTRSSNRVSRKSEPTSRSFFVHFLVEALRKNAGTAAVRVPAYVVRCFDPRRPTHAYIQNQSILS